MVNRQAKDNDTESSVNGNFSMGWLYVEAKKLKAQVYDFLLCAQRSKQFLERCNWSLLERDIRAWCERTLKSQHVVNHEINTILMTLTIPE